MDQVKKILFALLSKALNFILARKNIGIYFCFAALYCILCGMIGFAVLVLVFLQGIVLLVLTKPNAAIKSLSHRMTVYLYKMMRYIVLCEARKPYPFGPVPQEIEPADDVDLTADLPEKNFFDRKAAQGGQPESGEKEETGGPIPMGHSNDSPQQRNETADKAED